MSQASSRAEVGNQYFGASDQPTNPWIVGGLIAGAILLAVWLYKKL